MGWGGAGCAVLNWHVGGGVGWCRLCCTKLACRGWGGAGCAVLNWHVGGGGEVQVVLY